MRSLLSEMGYDMSEPTILWVDNMGAVEITKRRESLAWRWRLRGRLSRRLSLSEAALLGPKGFWWKQKCAIGQPLGDPENPPCARLVLTGTVVKPDAESDEAKRAMAALLLRHPSFANYPSGHGFYVAKMEISAAWEIDKFGGAAIISPADYFKAKP